jgi:RNA polymerase sigma-70 factor (ECF subfamily)
MQLEPIIYREVIYLYYYAEMSIKEIAKNINRTDTNTKTILYRARKKLGKKLKGDSYEF